MSTSILASIAETVSIMFNTPLIPPTPAARKNIDVQLMEMPPSRTPSNNSSAIPIAPGVTTSSPNSDAASSQFSNSSATSSASMSPALHDAQAVVRAYMDASGR
ncbi:hypothetical protein NEOLEDRAFT_1245482 [Neolentinus lepideus HHB14362 ss-1]|uniref:Uncharacterized protein n=1 Tax=Neolentinus lepideus HHB14362 ss-1 TaxID=1314782 RepID=A0A165NQE8_9AGAM|nr:hypothetical protein NEOLEDRAFT_1245482 [Neolentinus lepideus HHB14362 ss-1]